MDDENETTPATLTPAHEKTNGGPMPEPTPQENLVKWRNSLGKPLHTPEDDKLKEGLLLVAELAEANLEQSMRNGSAIEILKGQMETVVSKTEIGGNMVDRVDRDLIETTKAYKAELTALKIEVAQTKSIVESIAAHLGITMPLPAPAPEPT